MKKVNQTWQVAAWEFMHFFKWKQELLSKLVMLVIAGVVFFWSSSDELTQSQYKVAVVGAPDLTVQNDDFVLSHSQLSTELLLKKVALGELDAVLVATSKSLPAEFVLHTQGKMSWQQTLMAQINAHYMAEVTVELGLNEQKLSLLQQPVIWTAAYLDEAVKQETGTSSNTAIGVMVLMSVGIFVSFAQIFVSITGEKQQRVTEQLYACMSAQTWIDGKIIGQVLLALKAMASTLLSVVLGIAFMQVVIDGTSLDLSIVDLSLLPWLTLFALLGLYLSTAFMAAIAAAIDDPNHSGKTSFMMLPLLPMMLAFVLMDSPSGFAMTFLSYFPLTAFAVMPVKMALVDLPMWQPLLALVISLLTCFYIRTVAGRLFKMGMVTYGKEPSVKQMLSWAIR